MKTLRKGDRGPEVRTLQEKLTTAGYLLSPIDDKFGPNTDTALRKFQTENKLKVDGVACIRCTRFIRL
jgi:peptidoglycan hydrolase-like protein with peptidoglycan-binding domain